MDIAEEEPKFAQPATEEPAAAADETMLRLVREHPMPADEASPAPEPDAPAEAQPEPPPADLGTTAITRGRSVVGLDVGSRTLKLVHLQTGGAGVRLVGAIERELPPSSDPDRLEVVTEIVQAFVAEAKPRIKAASAAIAGNGTATACCTMPKMSEKELANALRWKVAENESVDTERATVGYYTLKGDRPAGQTQAVVAAAPPHIHRLDTAFSNDRPRLSVVVTGPIAAENVVMASYQAEERAPAAILDIGTDASRLTIVGPHGLEFTREIPVGGDTITAALSGTVSVDGGSVEVSRQAAELIKKQYAIGSDGAVTAGGVSLPAGRILGAIRPVLERLASEVVRSIQFYAQSHHLAKVETLYLCGGGALLGGLPEYFTREAHIATARLDPWRLLGFELPADLDAAPAAFVTATGAAIHDGARLNLLPARIRARRTISAIRTVSLIASSMALVVLGGLSWTAARQVRELKNVQRLKAESARPMERTAAKVASAQRYERALAKRQKILDTLGVGKAMHAAILNELSNVMPEGTYLRSVSFPQDKAVRRIALTVEVYAMPDVGAARLKQRLIAALEDSPYFVNVSFRPTSRDGAPKGPGRSPDEVLTLSCQILGFPGDDA